MTMPNHGNPNDYGDVAGVMLYGITLSDTLS